ncbi:MAG: hypothetical protein KAZ71_09175 [Bacteroidia bacterium]|nr:hypothetical protein [Bacteroidia bacterium]
MNRICKILVLIICGFSCSDSFEPNIEDYFGNFIVQKDCSPVIDSIEIRIMPSSVNNRITIHNLQGQRSQIYADIDKSCFTIPRQNFKTLGPPSLDISGSGNYDGKLLRINYSTIYNAGKYELKSEKKYCYQKI